MSKLPMYIRRMKDGGDGFVWGFLGKLLDVEYVFTCAVTTSYGYTYVLYTLLRDEKVMKSTFSRSCRSSCGHDRPM